MPKPLTAAQCLHVIALLLGILFSGFWTMDELTDPLPAASGRLDAPVPPVEPARLHGGPPRMFVLVLDSLRYETAIDPSLMPNLVALRQRGVFAKVLTTHDAVSVPALRAAFTGRDRTTVFGFVKNFWHGEEAFTSLFTEMQRHGLSVSVYSDGSFKQFGRDLDHRASNSVGGHYVRRQLTVFDQALRSYLDREYDVMVMHLSFTDTVAHHHGIHSPEYARVFGIADALVQQVDEAVPADETFMVVGDHGHDEVGRHQMGMDVPTFTVYRGPAFRRGVDLGTIPIMDSRYLCGWALHLPLPSDYASGRHPEALVPQGPMPAAYAQAHDALEARERAGGVPAARRPAFFLAMLGLALLAGLWIDLLRSAGTGAATPWWHALGTWLTVGLVGFPPALPAGRAVAVALGAALLAGAVLRGGGRRAAPRALLPFVAALALERWGWLLSVIRPEVHYPEYVTVAAAWAALAAVGLAVSLRWGAMAGAWLLLGLTGLLLYPSVYRYGAPSAMAPVWAATLLFAAVESWRATRPADGPRRSPLARHHLLLPAVLLLLLPFGLAYAENFRFVNWFGPIAWRVFGSRFSEEPLLPGLAVALGAKLVLFVRWRASVPTRLLGVGLAVGLHAVMLKGTGFSPAESPRWIYVAAIGACLAAAMLLGRWPRRLADRDHLVRLAWLAGLYLLFYYTIRLPAKSYVWADWLLGALALTAWFFRRDEQRCPRPSAYAWLVLVGVIVTGWMTLAWTFHRLEWGFVFDWFPVRFVEKNVGIFCAVIAFRYAVPLVMIRILLAEALGNRYPYPQRLVTLLAGIKTLSVLMIACGMGFHRTGSDVYLEAVQQTGVWAFLFVALPWRGHRRSRATKSTAG